MNIHIDLDKLPIIKQESIDKIIYKVFYLTFKNKNNGKKYKTPIYKIRIKNNCISDINMIFKKKRNITINYINRKYYIINYYWYNYYIYI